MRGRGKFMPPASDVLGRLSNRDVQPCDDHSGDRVRECGEAVLGQRKQRSDTDLHVSLEAEVPAHGDVLGDGRCECQLARVGSKNIDRSLNADRQLCSSAMSRRVPIKRLRCISRQSLLRLQCTSECHPMQSQAQSMQTPPWR